MLVSQQVDPSHKSWPIFLVSYYVGIEQIKIATEKLLIKFKTMLMFEFFCQLLLLCNVG